MKEIILAGMMLAISMNVVAAQNNISPEKFFRDAFYEYMIEGIKQLYEAKSNIELLSNFAQQIPKKKVETILNEIKKTSNSDINNVTKIKELENENDISYQIAPHLVRAIYYMNKVIEMIQYLASSSDRSLYSSKYDPWVLYNKVDLAKDLLKKFKEISNQINYETIEKIYKENIPQLNDLKASNLMLPNRNTMSSPEQKAIAGPKITKLDPTQKTPSVQKITAPDPKIISLERQVKDLESKLTEAQKKAEYEKKALQERSEKTIRQLNDESSSLKKLSKRAEKEFGEGVVKKMKEETDLELSDLFDNQEAQFGKLLNNLQIADESLFQNPEKIQKILAQLKNENKQYKKELADLKKKIEKKLPQQKEVMGDEIDEIAQLKAENTTLKNKNEELEHRNQELDKASAMEGTQEILLAKDKLLNEKEQALRDVSQKLLEANLQIQENTTLKNELERQLQEARQMATNAIESEKSYIEQIGDQLSKWVGSDVANAVLDRMRKLLSNP